MKAVRERDVVLMHQIIREKIYTVKKGMRENRFEDNHKAHFLLKDLEILKGIMEEMMKDVMGFYFESRRFSGSNLKSDDGDLTKRYCKAAEIDLEGKEK